MKPHEFWGLTFVEFGIMVEAKLEKDKENFIEIITSSWYQAAFSRTKKLPKLNTLIKRISKSKKNKSSDDDELIRIANNKGLNGPWQKGGKVNGSN